MEYACKKCGLIQADPIISKNGPHMTARCNSCESYISHVIQDKSDFTFYIGKHKGRSVKSMLENAEERSYLVWAYSNMTTLKDWQKSIISGLLHL